MTVTYLPRGIIPPVEYACATGGGFVCCSSLLPSSPSQWSCVNGHVALYPPSLRADGVLPSSTNDLAAFAARLDDSARIRTCRTALQTERDGRLL